MKKWKLKMKLNIKIYNATPRIEKIKLSPELAELLDSYVNFYQEEFKSSIKTDQVMVEMLLAFIKSDRVFMRWHRSKTNDKQT